MNDELSQSDGEGQLDCSYIVPPDELQQHRIETISGNKRRSECLVCPQ